MRFRIYRFDPGKPAKPFLQDYEVTLAASDRKVLDALERIVAAETRIGAQERLTKIRGLRAHPFKTQYISRTNAAEPSSGPPLTSPASRSQLPNCRSGRLKPPDVSRTSGALA